MYGIDGIVERNFLEVDDVFEIPAHNESTAGDSSYSYMQCIVRVFR